MQLDLNLLTALDALLEEESVGGAAARLHLSEPAMSRSLGRIRKATQDPILVRTGRTMTPTPRALAMRDEVRGLVLRSQTILSPETELDLGSLARTFTLLCHDALASALSPLLMREFQRSAPKASLRFLNESAEDSQDLGRGAVDLQIGSESSPSVHIAHQHVADDHLIGLARSDILAASNDGAMTLTDFVGLPQLVVSRRGRFSDHVDSALDSAGYARRVIASVASTAAAVEIVHEIGAVVIVPSAVGRRLTRGGDLRTFTLPVELPRVPIVLSWHRRLETDLAHGWLREVAAAAIRSVIDPRP